MNQHDVLKRLKTDDLRYLLAVASLGRIGAAADQLDVDASTISRRLRALEIALGAKLLTNSAEGWELTDFGRTIAESARPIEAALETVARAASGESEDVISGNFRLSSTDAFATAFAVPALARLRSEHPGLEVEIITATRQLNLHQSGFDLAVGVGAPVTRRLFTEPLAMYRLSFYATDAYLRMHGSPATVDDLRSHTVVFYVESLLQLGDLDLSHYAPGIDARFTSTNVFAQLAAAAHGIGIALLPKFMAIREPALRELTHLNIDGRLQFVLAARRESINRPTVQAVRNALRREVRLRSDELM